MTLIDANSLENVFELEEPLVNRGPSELVLAVEIALDDCSDDTQWQVEVTSSDVEKLLSDPLEQIARIEPSKWTPQQAQQLGTAVLIKKAENQELFDRIAAQTSVLNDAVNAVPTTMVMDERTERRQTYILIRGAYDHPGELVTAATPSSLPPMRADLPRNRLGLAKWLVDPANPLTARVTVNRFWQMLFGTGLVKTPEDFGAQGEPPSHPELLDFLASEFIDSGWDVKAMLRLIVTSAAYRQESRQTPEVLERDPENRLLARGPRFRLNGEFIRDQALSASGLLSEKIGGPSVKPYHPTGMYEQITEAQYTKSYEESHGANLYRRSLYTYWKRSVPNPAMFLFDAPLRESCTLRRGRTNTPLQSLNLMNDPTYVEAARFLAQRMMLEGGESIDDRLGFGFRLVLARLPKPEELGVLKNGWQRASKEFATDIKAAEELLTVGESKADEKLDRTQLAALTTVASTILNLDEAVTKE
jgi:hypothetical protein